MNSLSADTQSPLRRLAVELRYTVGLRVLPPRVARFHWRARRLAWRAEDRFSLVSATRPSDLSVLLGLARDRRRVVELGTATGWTAIALALADPRRQVITYDPALRPERERYLGLVAPAVRDRIEFVHAPGSRGPLDPGAVDLLYVDSSHEREATIAELEAWRPVLRPGSLIIFDDYLHPRYPGVREAVQALGMQGTQRGTLYVCELRHGDAAQPL
jgi:predicted O-methyltransferase YrrM